MLWESRVILTYLTAAYSKDDTLYPRDVRMRALVDQRLHFDLGTLYARLFDYFVSMFFLEISTKIAECSLFFKLKSLFVVDFSLQEPAIRGGTFDDKKKEKIFEALGFFESMLQGRTWAAGNNFTIADLALTVTVDQMLMFEIDLEPFTRIRDWLKRCKDHLRPHGYDVRILHSLSFKLFDIDMF